VKKNYQDFDLHIFSLLAIWRSGYWSGMSVCMYCTLLEPEWLDRFYSHSFLKSLAIIGWCLVNMNFVASKIRTLQMDPIEQNSDFLKKCL
jgi:hypothetical protein